MAVVWEGSSAWGPGQQRRPGPRTGWWGCATGLPRGSQAGSGRAGRADGGAAGIGAAVVAEGAGPRAPAAPLQHAWVEVGMAACVLGQVVAAHEALLADGAAELLLARVCAVVPCQLVRARKLLVAVLPAAGKGPLTWGAQGRERVSLCAAHRLAEGWACHPRHPGEGPQNPTAALPQPCHSHP